MALSDIQFFFDLGLQRCRWDEYDYTVLKRIPIDQKRGKAGKRQNNCFIMLDTETSKSGPDEWSEDWSGRKQYKVNHNYIVAWSLAISVYGYDIALITGSRPSECTECLNRIQDNLRGDLTVVYVHNLTYDYTFLRLFLFRDMGKPVMQLNTKPHYPIIIEFVNGIQLRDSLILAQRGLEKWAEDMHVEHQKAVGSWDYDRIRNQGEELSKEEQLYIGNDVLAGVECLAALRAALGKTYRGMPFTATGIVRGRGREIGSRNNAHRDAVKQYGPAEDYFRQEHLYHGGYTHSNRHINGYVIREEEDGLVTARDFASSYPFQCFKKFPMERFRDINLDLTPEDILSYSEEMAFIFQLELIGVELKDPDWPFPVLQVSKVDLVYEAAIDNGRILDAGYVRLQTNEIDFSLISRYYKWKEISVSRVQYATKDYLPRWLTDMIFDLYRDKTTMKGGDPVLYNIRKASLNSVYGMMVQKLVRNEIVEDYDTGEYHEKRPEDPEQEYDKAVKKRGTFLVYQWGLYITSYAQQCLFDLIECTHDPVYDALYCDTDSCYGLHWEKKKLDAYNQKCKDLLLERGYGPVEHKGREYWLGVAEIDGEYSEFVALHSKCYACRDANTGKLKITVAGVPKKTGVNCLQDNIENFKPGFIFDGETTGKLTHIYQYVPEIFIDENGNEVGDSINLVPCDYELDESIESRIDDFMYEEVFIQTYDETE